MSTTKASMPLSRSFPLRFFRAGSNNAGMMVPRVYRSISRPCRLATGLHVVAIEPRGNSSSKKGAKDNRPPAPWTRYLVRQERGFHARQIVIRAQVLSSDRDAQTGVHTQSQSSSKPPFIDVTFDYTGRDRGSSGLRAARKIRQRVGFPPPFAHGSPTGRMK